MFEVRPITRPVEPEKEKPACEAGLFTTTNQKRFNVNPQDTGERSAAQCPQHTDWAAA